LFEEALRRYQIEIPRGRRVIVYERMEIKDMISYLKVIQNPDDTISLLRVINTPARGIGKTTLETLERLALETGFRCGAQRGKLFRRELLPAASAGGVERAFRS